jgi:hypothetical protein
VRRYAPASTFGHFPSRQRKFEVRAPFVAYSFWVIVRAAIGLVAGGALGFCYHLLMKVLDSP